VIADKLKPLFLVFLLVVVSQPVFAYITPCAMTEKEDMHSGHEMHGASSMNHGMAMENNIHENGMATGSETLSKCCGQINCELMYCSVVTAVLATSHFSISLMHSGVYPGGSLLPMVADLPVPTPPPIFR